MKGVSQSSTFEGLSQHRKIEMSGSSEKKNEGSKSFPLSKLFDKPVSVPVWLRKVSAPNLIAQQMAFNEIKYCATPNCENQNISWCHVIPSSAQLSQISNNGEVCWLPLREKDRYTMQSWWSQDPVSKTLVFRGFCSTCDSSLFRKIDQSLQLNNEAYMLLAYRASCYSLWRAEVDLRHLQLTPVEIRKMVDGDSSLPSLRADFDQNYTAPILEAERHRDAARNITNSLREHIDTADFESLTTHVFDFGRKLPFRYSVAGSFTTSMRHEHVDISQKECPPTPSVYIHMLNVDSSTKLIVSWPKHVPSRYPNAWLDELIQYSNSGHLADVLLRYMFINNHGLVFNPSLVPTLRHEQSSFLTSPLATTYYHSERPDTTRICEPPYFDYNWKLSPIQSET